MKILFKLSLIFLSLIICSSFFGAGHDVFNLLSVSIPCRVENQDGDGIADVDVSLFCLDMTSGKESLFFLGNSQFNGEVLLKSQTDTDNLPELYALKLLLKTKSFELEKIIDGNPDQNKFLALLNPIVIDDKKSSSLFESTWSASLDNIASDKYKLNAFMQNKSLSNEIVHLTIKSNVTAEIFIDNEFVGISPLELPLVYKSEHPVYYIRLLSEGYEEKILVVDLSNVAITEEKIAIEEYVKLVPIE